jgi:hypothetical protein
LLDRAQRIRELSRFPVDRGRNRARALEERADVGPLELEEVQVAAPCRSR